MAQTSLGAMTGRPTRDSERIWRRRSLLALLVLVPLTLAEQAYDSVMAWMSAEDLIARDVSWGKSAHYGGSDWKLADLQAAWGMSNLPPDSVPVLADFSVTVGDADLQNLWMMCRIDLVDAAGRHWSPTSAVPLRVPDDMRSCNLSTLSGAKTGDTLKVRETFLVPKDAIASIRPTVSLVGGRPYYLRFQRPES